MPLQAWSGPEGSRRLRFTDFVTLYKGKKLKPAITGLEWPRGFQEVKINRFRDFI